MNKKKIIILVGAALVSIGAGAGVGLFFKKSAPPVQEVANQGQKESGGQDISSDFLIARDSGAGLSGDLEQGMSERKLEGLIYDMIERKDEYKYKKSELEELEERIKVATETLQQNISRLNSLRDQLETSIATLKQQQDNLDSTVFEIDALEKMNLQRIAVRYDAMKPKKAAQVMINMNKNRQLNDVVQIIYYMNDKKSAKLLDELSSTEPTLVAVVTDKLKRIKESN